MTLTGNCAGVSSDLSTASFASSPLIGIRLSSPIEISALRPRWTVLRTSRCEPFSKVLLRSGYSGMPARRRHSARCSRSPASLKTIPATTLPNRRLGLDCQAVRFSASWLSWDAQADWPCRDCRQEEVRHLLWMGGAPQSTDYHDDVNISSRTREVLGRTFSCSTPASAVISVGSFSARKSNSTRRVKAGSSRSRMDAIMTSADAEKS